VDEKGVEGLGALNRDGSAERLRGSIFSALTRTGEQANVVRLLAPVVPTAILGVGLNYRRHAAESGANVPENPVLFVKGNNTLQHPGDPIEIPTTLPSSKVDYECELAVDIGREGRQATLPRRVGSDQCELYVRSGFSTGLERAQQRYDIIFCRAQGE
jgi:2-keto-4-pentenoate hydratase/2-oxohepta-3-ene-1,7-dioic acid hydratase in catechol pathway